jgi:hypothetical protein
MNYPKINEEWRKAIHNAFGISPDEGRKLYTNKALPGVGQGFSLAKQRLSIPKGLPYKNCGKNFIEALNRNKNDFISWIYGEGSEPYWPGKDKEC